MQSRYINKRFSNVNWVMNNFIIQSVTTKFRTKTLYIVLWSEKFKMSYKFVVDISEIIQDEIKKNAPGKLLISKNIFNNVITDDYGVSWKDTDGFSLGLDTLLKYRKFS